MNVTFRMENEAQEQAFIDYAKGLDIIGIKGHRSVGGLRASISNAAPVESVDFLCDALRNFQG